MMRLNAFDFKPDYNKANDDIAEEFYLPCMENSIIYDRVSGYFGSTIYIIAWTALKQFVANGGKMRIICSPFIIDEDQAALVEGYSARNSEQILDSLKKEINNLFGNEYLNKPARILACLVAIGVINIKIAIIKPEASPEIKRLFHDKVGVFKDSIGNCVGFRGSMNETFKGLSSDGNIESIDVFPNWLDDRDRARVENVIKYFNELWTDNITSIQVYDFPSAVKELFTQNVDKDNWEELIEEVKTQIDLDKKWTAEKKKNDRTPRAHQVKALEAWEQNGRRGIFEHATGSGKTYTAMCAIRPALDKGEVPLILVPSKELLTQWEKELRETFHDIKFMLLICGGGHDIWKKKGYLSAWTASSANKKKLLLSTIDTAASDQFLKNISQGTHLFLIADEVHRLGSAYRKKVFKLDTGARLGLSATPKRYGDDKGTHEIFSYFGGIIPPPFTLYDAISSGILTKYFYYPHEIKLNQNEQADWDCITNKLSKLIASKMSTHTNMQEVLSDSQIKILLIQRARIIKNASAKAPLAVKVLKNHFQYGQRWIIYCDNQTQLYTVLDLLKRNGFDAYDYHSAMEGNREMTIRYFEINGGVLVSIKCLDEGIDIPAATHALILASSKNPREFIQRRGRILRKADNKPFAFLHDAIVTPNKAEEENTKQNSIIEAELARAIQFGEWAENPTCISKLRNIAIDFGINIIETMNGGYEEDDEE